LLETDVPSDDHIVVLAGELRKLWDWLSELRSFLCERRLERTVLRPAPCQNCTVYSVFPTGVTSHSKIAQFNWECIGRLRPAPGLQANKHRSWIRSRTICNISKASQSFVSPVCDLLRDSISI
jgi:hypothetical protein